MNVQARVVHINPAREFKRSSGETGRVASIDIKDETGSIALVLWGEHAYTTNKLFTNDIVTVQNAYVKEGSRGSIELNLERAGEIAINQ